MSVVGVFRRFCERGAFLSAAKIFDGKTILFKNRRRQRIAFRMDPRRVKGIVAADDAHEARALTIGGIRDAVDFLKLFARTERALRTTIFDNIFDGKGRESDDVAERLGGGGVDVDADAVDASRNDATEDVAKRLHAQFATEGFVAKELGRNLNVFFQRIDQTTTQRDGGAFGSFEVRQLFLGDFA